LPQSSLKADFHCVTHWSRFGDVWEGVFFRDLMKQLHVKPEAKHVIQHAYGGYTTNLPLAWMLEEDVMLVHRMNGAPLDPEHGGAASGHYSKKVRMEGRKMAQRSGVPCEGCAWILGAEWIQQFR
jgi:hypothetical protein